EKRVFLVILFTSFSGSLVSRIPGAVQSNASVSCTILSLLNFVKPVQTRRKVCQHWCNASNIQ
ncbi:hypothetical protein MZG54_21950, partial [Escherichia coli]|nr:hypothetical protein [Escherichia coli]MCK3002768.1 hypothetical protein [Escherichia coli]MCK3035842.1 hypothetical protein [Escherichia coli]